MDGWALSVLFQFLNIVDTHPSGLIERVVKLCFHGDLSVRMGVDQREP